MDQVSQIRDQVDIVALIGEYITLKKAGRNFKSPCPFHNEKSPSFVVSPERQIWHCFGCGKGGDCYTFLMEYEHLEFPEALRALAKRTGIELQQSEFESSTSSKKESIYHLNKLAAEFYHFILMNHKAGEKAREYLKERNVSEKVLKSFLIGYAPSGAALSSYLLQKKKVNKEDLIESGLVTDRGYQVRDFFWDRIMFPLFDHRDNIMGFSGRILTAESTGPKYINTRETLVYHKGDMFFGLNMTKEAIKKENQALLVEGEFDVLSCFQNGVPNVVAVKGTALTERQVALLGRFAQKITVCFDGDRAGQEAIKRSLPIIEKKGLNTTVVVIPGGKDPDESIKNDPTAFKIAVKNDIGIYDYLLSSTLKNYDKASLEGKQKISEDLLPLFSSIQNEIIKEHYLKKVSTELDTTYESILRELERMQKRETPRVEESIIPAMKVSPIESREEYLLSLIIQAEVPKIALEKAVSIMSEALGKERAYQKILHHLLTYFETTEAFNSQHFGNSLPTELATAYDKSLLFPLSSSINTESRMKEVVKIATHLKEMYLKERIKFLTEEIRLKEAEDGVNEEEVNLLKDRFSKTIALLHK
jgi:DNA primase